MSRPKKEVSKSALEFFTNDKNSNITVNQKLPQKNNKKVEDVEQYKTVETIVSVDNEIDITESADKNGDKLLENSTEL